ncbi:MAG: MFS transporter [Clostridia bacterium]|nr:MFS transporter [Clostridia bacterium]
MGRKKAWGRSTWLLALCWLVYTASLLGKVNYAANISQIEEFFKVSHARAGVASTCYFFAYGIGQVVNGVCCKRYNVRYAIFGGLLVSAAANLCVPVIGNFELIPYFWLVNGFALSMLWPCLIRLLSETLPKQEMVRASVVMGTTTAVGTVLVYSSSALFAAVTTFHAAFYLAAILVPVVAIVWLLAYPALTRKDEGQPAEEEVAPAPTQTQQTGGKASKEMLVVICLLALFAIAVNLLMDGSRTWVPSILKENFALDASFSILLTLCLPLVSIFGNFFANVLYKKTKNFVMSIGLLFFGAALFIVGVLFSLSISSFVLCIACFALVSFLTGSCNSTITSIFPLQMKGKVNSGMIAGVLNGFCYVGSTISSYGLGLVADFWGWEAVFYLFLAVAIAVTVIAGVYCFINGLIKKRK